MGNELEDIFAGKAGPDAMVSLLRMRVLVAAVNAAARLGVADHLSGGPRTVDELAQATGSDRDALQRLLRCLAGAGIFEETAPATFAQSPLSETLSDDSPSSIRAFAEMYGADWYARTIDGLFDSVRTGEPAFVKLFGKPGYEFLKEHPEQAKLAHRAMESYTERFEKPALDRHDFSWASVIVDVGGGSGAFLAQVLARTPQARGILAERPEVAEQARKLLRERGVAERCEVAAIDMFESVPKGGDAYVIKRVIHNWSDEQATRLLANCRKAMRPDGRVLVIEAVIRSEGAGLFGKLGDLQQLALGAGRGRTDREFRRLCEAAGLRVDKVLSYGEHVTIIEAVAA